MINWLLANINSPLTWQEEPSDLIVAGCERVVDPTAANEKASLEVVLYVGQRPEAVHPQTQAVQLGAGYSLIAHQPTGRREGNNNGHEADEKHTHPAGSGQAAFLHVGKVSNTFAGGRRLITRS